MTKQEFVDKIAAKTDLSRRDAAKAVDAFLETVTESLKGGNDITAPSELPTDRETLADLRS